MSRKSTTFRSVLSMTCWRCAQSYANPSPPAIPCYLTGKLTGNFAFLGPQKPISLHETTVLQRLFTKFPTQINRENISRNRDFLAGNREFCRKRVRVHFSHTCCPRFG